MTDGKIEKDLGTMFSGGQWGHTGNINSHLSTHSIPGPVLDILTWHHSLNKVKKIVISLLRKTVKAKNWKIEK